MAVSEEVKQVLMVSVTAEGFNSNIQDPIESRIIYALRQTNLYNVIERNELKVILKEQALSLSGFIKTTSALEVGELIGAELSILGRINNLNKFYTFDLKLINNTTGIIINSVSLQIPPSTTAIFNNISKAIMELTGYTNSQIELRDIPVREIRLNPSITTIAPQATCQAHNGPVAGLLSHNHIFYSIGQLGEISEWNPANNFSKNPIFKYAPWKFFNSLLTHSGGYLFVTGLDGVIFFWDTNRWGNPYQINASHEMVTAITSSKDGSKIYSADAGGNLNIWDIDTQKLVSSKTIFSANVLSLLENDDGLGIFALSANGNIDLYHFKTRELIFSENTRQVDNIELINALRGNTLISVNKQGTIQTWDKSPYSETRFVGNRWLKPGISWRNMVSLKEGEVTAVSFSPSEDIMSIGFDSGSLIIIDTMSGNILARNNQSRATVTAIEFLNDQQFITGHKDGNIVSWLIN